MADVRSNAGPDQDVLEPCCDRCAILAVMQRYGDLAESGEFDRLDEVFDANARISAESLLVEGLSAIIAMLSAMPRPRAHMFSAGHVVKISNDQATARFTAIIVRQEDELGVMRVEDDFVHGSGGWRVIERRLYRR